MTHKERLKICIKINKNKKKIADKQEMIANNKSSGLDSMNRELKAEVLKLRMENEKHLVLLEAGIIIITSDSAFEESFIENHAMDVLLVVLTLVNIYIMMETWK